LLVGVDIIDIERMEQAVKRTPRILERVFTREELEYCLARNNPYPSLAVRFAAREALRKLDVVFTNGIGFHDVEVVLDTYGKPFLFLHHRAREKAEQAGITDLAVSLSHSKTQAIAVVIGKKG
jgi:holo-[acyl-carrier protein] synthase